MKVFEDILVMPTQGLRNGVTPDRRVRRGIFQGGPIWPWFPIQIRARTCRGFVPLPFDVRPVAPGIEARSEPVGVWCGPVSPHFGHMIADFGMRIAVAAQTKPDLPLVFSMWPQSGEQPPPFFWGILAHFGVPPDNVRLVREPTRFGRLWVCPQAERMFGPAPTSRHLDLLDRIVAARGDAPQDIPVLYVSRSGFADGRLAGEAYLDDVLAACGATIMHPETLDVAQQVDHYRRARAIVFSEGSAVHSLQLLGRLKASVTVLVRRRGSRIAARALAARAQSLSYRDASSGSIEGLDRKGRIHTERALVLLDGEKLIDAFAPLGIELRPQWSPEEYRRRRDRDLCRAISYWALHDLHPKALPTIEKAVRRNRLAIDAAAAWNTPYR